MSKVYDLAGAVICIGREISHHASISTIFKTLKWPVRALRAAESMNVPLRTYRFGESSSDSIAWGLSGESR